MRGIFSMTFASPFHFYFIFCRHTASPQKRAHGGTALIFMAKQICWRQNLGPPLKNDQKWSKFGSGVNLMIQIKPPANPSFPSRWAYHAKNSSWYTLLKYSSPSIVHHILANFDSKMVAVPSRLWLLLFHPRLSGTAGWGATTLCSRSLRKYSSRKSRMEEQ